MIRQADTKRCFQVKDEEALNPYMDYTLYGAPLFDVETNERLNIVQNDINTYVNSSAAKFIKGEMSFDEWDNYVATVNKMGVEEWIGIYQAVLDTYQ